VSRQEFIEDLRANMAEMTTFGLPNYTTHVFIPPYEWYNQQHVEWAAAMGITLFNFSPGTSANADYTVPEMENYRSSQAIWDRLFAYEKEDPRGLNGFILLIHIGTDPRRTDKFYHRLAALIDALRGKGYSFIRIDELVERADKERRR
jgi:peptidoglycan/xylan/chitin deacetylase (PgdA/CDA1 family)